MSRRVWAEMLADTAVALNSTLDLDEILKLILENIQQIIPHDSSNIMLLEQGFAHVVQHNGWRPEKVEMLVGIKFPIQQAAHLSLMYQSHQSCIIGDVKALDGWLDVAPDYDPLSYLAAPICVGDDVIGFLNLDSMRRDHFTPDHAHRLQAFVSHAAVALKNAQAYRLSQTLAALEERQRLARDLHDSVTQTLFAASITANAILKRWRQDSSSINEGLLELRDLTQGALAEMRTMLLELRPNALLESKLSDLLQQLIETVQGRARIKVRYDTSGNRVLPPNVQVSLFRIAQEALKQRDQTCPRSESFYAAYL